MSGMLVGLFVIFVIAWHHPQHTVFGSGRIVDNVRGIKFQILAEPLINCQSGSWQASCLVGLSKFASG